MIDTYIFIGMAGVGKSTIGAYVAKHLNLKFYDIDSVIANEYKEPINELISRVGIEEFNRIESESLLSLVGNNHIIAPGGSFIYCSDAIESIKDRTKFIFLYDNAKNIKNRINNIESRGIIGLDTRTFEELYYERLDLYKSIGNVEFNLEYQSFQMVCDNIIAYMDCLL